VEQSVCGKEAELKKEITNLRCDLETKQVECDRLAREIASLKEDLRARENKSEIERETLEKEINELRSQMDRTTVTLNTVIEEKKKLRKDYVELCKLNAFTMRVTGGENEGSIENFDFVVQEDEDLDHVRVVEKNVRTYEDQYGKLKKMVDTLNANNSDCREKITALEDICKRQREEKELFERESEQLRVELTTALQRLESFSLEKSQILQKVVALEDTCKRHQEEKDVLKKEKEELRVDLRNATITLQSQQTQFADTECETAALKEKLIASALNEVRLKGECNVELILKCIFFFCTHT